VLVCVTVICILFCVCVYFLFSLCCKLFGFFPLQLSPSVLWYCWLGLLTCKNRLPYNLYCVGGDVKHCSIQSNPMSYFFKKLVKWHHLLACLLNNHGLNVTQAISLYKMSSMHSKYIYTLTELAYSVSQKIHPPPLRFSDIFSNGWQFLINFSHTYYMFLSMLDYKFLFNYLQLWRSYAILRATC